MAQAANYVPSQAAIDRAKPFLMKALCEKNLNMLNKIMKAQFPIDYKINEINTVY